MRAIAEREDWPLGVKRGDGMLCNVDEYEYWVDLGNE
jgi:hypothetical protein